MDSFRPPEHRYPPAAKGEAQKVLDMGQALISDNNLVPDDMGFYTFDVPMGVDVNRDGEAFIQSCGFLSMFRIEGVYFPPPDEELPEALPTAEEIHDMDKSRKVSWNPDLLKQFLEK